MDEYFYDDELYLSTRNAECCSNRSSPISSYRTSPVHKSLPHPRSRHTSWEKEKTSVLTAQLKGRSVKSNLPMKTVLKKTESPSKNVKQGIVDPYDEYILIS